MPELPITYQLEVDSRVAPRSRLGVSAVKSLCLMTAVRVEFPVERMARQAGAVVEVSEKVLSSIVKNTLDVTCVVSKEPRALLLKEFAFVMKT